MMSSNSTASWQNSGKRLSKELHKWGRSPEIVAKRFGVPYDLARLAWKGDRDAIQAFLDNGWTPLSTVFKMINLDKPTRVVRKAILDRIVSSLDWKKSVR